MCVKRLEGWVHYGYENFSWLGVGSNKAKDKQYNFACTCTMLIFYTILQ